MPDAQPGRRRKAVDLLTPDQLKRKREHDRKEKRELRARTKARIEELEAQVQGLASRLASVSEAHSLLLSTEQRQDGFEHAIRSTSGPLQSITRDDMTSSNQNAWDGSPNTTNTFIQSAHAGIDTLAWNELFGEASTHFDSYLPSVDMGAVLQAASEPFEQPSIEVWAALPRHLPPTCRLDVIFMNLIRTSKAFGTDGQNTFEFSSLKYPSVSALLNPEEEANDQPVTSTIVKDVIYFHTVPTLPEQIAIMFVMCLIIRWQITPSEQNFDALPEFLKPVPAQLTTSHAAWVDCFPWPKARDKICRTSDYNHKHDQFKSVCNDTISINWPYDSTDTLLATANFEYMINPIFEKHIRDLSNWTLGPAFIQQFPDFVGLVNIKE